MATTNASAATGACTKKIARQSSSWVSMPPSAGPMTAPAIPAAAQRRMPAARGAAQRAEHRQRRTEKHRGTGALHAPRQQERGRAPGQPGAQGGSREQRKAASHQQHGVNLASQWCQEQSAHTDDERVCRDDPRHTDDRGVELGVDLGEGKDDDRRVGERQRDSNDKRHGRDAAPARGPRRRGRSRRRWLRGRPRQGHGTAGIVAFHRSKG